MEKTPLKVAITGAAGRIAYDLMFRIASGEMLGEDQPVELRLVDIPGTLEELEGRAMEIHDCAFDTLHHVEIGSDPVRMFDGVNFALLVGGKPRGPGMSRSDLLADNGRIFIEQGRALNQAAASDIKVLITANPANTNALITMTHAPDIPQNRFSALTRLDHDRARHRLGKKLGVRVEAVKKMSVWGNHSNTQYPDIFHTEVNGQPAFDLINDWDWLENEFIPAVANRGAAVIQARGSSSVNSASNATMQAMNDWFEGTPENDWVSMAVATDGSYGIPEGLISSFPVIVRDGQYEIVHGLEHNEFSQKKIDVSIAELLEEREMVRSLGLL